MTYEKGIGKYKGYLHNASSLVLPENLESIGIDFMGGFGENLCKKQVFYQQFSEKIISADFGKLVLHIVIDKAVMRQRAAASLLGA